MLHSGAVDKPVVIVNPRSGGGLSEKRWARTLGPITDGLGMPFDTRFTEYRGHALEIAREESLAGRSLVIALGGDGTISETANGILQAGKGATLGILPRGTGGDFRRSLDLPSDFYKAAEHLRQAKTRSIDVGRVHFTGEDGRPSSRYFVNIASFGFSSEVARLANQSSKRFGGKVAFLGAAMRGMATYENTELTLTVDGEEEHRLTVLLGAVGNGRFFGGGMKICPEATLDDGYLDLVTVGDLGRVETLAKFHRIYSGTHLSMKEVGARRCRAIHANPVDLQAKIPIEIDGETPGHLPARFEVLENALRLRV